MVDLIEFIVKQLVDKPDEVVVTGAKDNIGETITICVASDDTGKIIGKQGRIATAVRTIAKAVGNKNNIKYKIDIVDKVDKVEKV